MFAVRKFACLLAAFVATGATASAAPITSFAGNYGAISPAPTPVGGVSMFQLGTTSITAATGQPPVFVGSTGTAVELNTVSVANAASGQVALGLSGGGNTLTFSLPGGGSVEFTFLNPAAFAIANVLGQDFFNATQDIYVSGVTGPVLASDFGGLNRIYSFSSTIVAAGGIIGIPGTPGAIQINSTAAGSFSAVITDRFQPGPPVPGVPEPMTFATFGALVLFGGYAARRKLKAASVAQA